MCALEEMGWLLEFVTSRVWRCAKWATYQAVARPYAGPEELRCFARACDSTAQWTAYGMAVLSFTCLLRVGEGTPSGVAGAVEGAWGFTPLNVTHTSSEGSGGATTQGMAAMDGPRGIHISGPAGTLLPTRGGLPPNGHGDPPQGMCERPRAVACVEEGWVGGLALVGFTGQMALWGHWMSESVAAHYGDAPDDFSVADNVELPWPSARGGMEWERRVVSLKDMFPWELLALCVREKDVGQEEVLGGWRDAEATAESRAGRSRREEGGGGGGQGDSQPAGGGWH